jgi:lipopolysaccharide exporter
MAARRQGGPHEALAQHDHALWSAFAASVRDNIAGETAVQALRLGATVALARALTPGDFGLFRILLIICAFATLFTEAGIPDALIQRDALRPEHESTAFWLTSGLGALVAGVLYAGAPVIARLMAMPRLVESARLLCLPILLAATAVTSDARLRRELRFGALAVADVLGEVGFITAAFWSLALGMPLWSLPAGLAARLSLRAATLWAADARLPRVAPNARAAGDFARFASTVCGARLLTAISSNADYALVGRMLGSSALGLYSIAWDILRFVPDRLHRVAGRVTFPAFCRLRGEDRRLATAYRDFFGYLARIVPAFAVCAAIVAPELLATVYGPRWIAAALPMRLLATGLMFAGLEVGIGSVYYATGHPSYDIYLHAGRLALIASAVFSLSAEGLSGVSAGMSAVETVVSVTGLGLACAAAGVDVHGLLEAAMPGFKVAALCAITAFGARFLAVAAGLDAPVALAVTAVAAMLVYFRVERSNLGAMLSAALGQKPQPVVAAAARQDG